MKTWMNEEGIDVFGDCPWHQDIIDATACAEKIGVPFEVADMIEEYRKQIVEYLVDEYRRGRTPNPDVLCNREIKFKAFLDFAMKLGADRLATGHFCQLGDAADGKKLALIYEDGRAAGSWTLPTDSTNWSGLLSTAAKMTLTAPAALDEASLAELKEKETYYFDLSGSEIRHFTTRNEALPDETLHYVPFTYAGTLNNVFHW